MPGQRRAILASSKYVCKDDSVKNEFFNIFTFLWVTFWLYTQWQPFLAPIHPMGLWAGTGTFILQARRAVMIPSKNVILLGSRESGQADSGRKEALIDGGGGEGDARFHCLPLWAGRLPFAGDACC